MDSFLFAMEEESESKQSTVESVMGKIIGKIHDHDSSSDSDHKNPSSPSSVEAKIYRVLGRERPVHHVLGGGKIFQLVCLVEQLQSGSFLS